MTSIMAPASIAWLNTLNLTLTDDDVALVAPRGMKTIELAQHTVCVDMLRPAVICPARKLSNAFMAAEAYWILTGDNRVDMLTPFNPRMATYSDDGKILAGAYGPPIHSQLDYIIKKLCEDVDTRQAVLTIWNRNPLPSKDIPCTVAMAFQIRGSRLNLHTFMRSSDQWLGLPYDIFSFSMLATLVCGALNSLKYEDRLQPGTLFLTAASSHLYEQHWTEAGAITSVGLDSVRPCKPTPKEFYTNVGKVYLESMTPRLVGGPGMVGPVAPAFINALDEARDNVTARWWLA